MLTYLSATMKHHDQTSTATIFVAFVIGSLSVFLSNYLMILTISIATNGNVVTQINFVKYECQSGSKFIVKFMNFDVTKKKLVTLISWSKHSYICQNLTIAGLEYKTESDDRYALNRSGLYMSYECNWWWVFMFDWTTKLNYGHRKNSQYTWSWILDITLLSSWVVFMGPTIDSRIKSLDAWIPLL